MPSFQPTTLAFFASSFLLLRESLCPLTSACQVLEIAFPPTSPLGLLYGLGSVEEKLGIERHDEANTQHGRAEVEIVICCFFETCLCKEENSPPPLFCIMCQEKEKRSPVCFFQLNFNLQPIYRRWEHSRLSFASAHDGRAPYAFHALSPTEGRARSWTEWAPQSHRHPRHETCPFRFSIILQQAALPSPNSSLYCTVKTWSVLKEDATQRSAGKTIHATNHLERKSKNKKAAKEWKVGIEPTTSRYF